MRVVGRKISRQSLKIHVAAFLLEVSDQGEFEVPAIITAASQFAAASASARAVKPAQQSLGFDDLIDAINPLQHIPVVSSIYRAITGDDISPTAEIAGGALFGGIIGAVTSLADVVFTQATGKHFGDGILAWLGIGHSTSKTQFAATGTSPASSPKPATPFDSNADPELAARTAIAYRSATALQEQQSLPVLSLSY
jgi:hypothetical protein